MSDYAAALFALVALGLGLMYFNDRRGGTYYDDVRCSQLPPIKYADGSTFYPDIVCEWMERSAATSRSTLR
jgi:hypothetical protein